MAWLVQSAARYDAPREASAGMANGGWDQRFLSSTRGQLIALLWRSPRTVDELAGALGITDNAVRAHLSSLERDGLVRQSGLRRSLGKPAHVYDVTAAAERLFPKAYGAVLRHLLDVLGERLTPDVVEAALREVGARLAAESGVSAHRAIRARITQAAAVFEDLGGLLHLEDDDDADSGKVLLRGDSCPLAAAVPSHPEMCRLMESLLSDLIGAPVRQRCERDDRPRCFFEITVGGRHAA
jgi:predicted ArsR family transcriptional regulator